LEVHSKEVKVFPAKVGMKQNSNDPLTILVNPTALGAVQPVTAITVLYIVALKEPKADV